jgi:ABC-type branched-subunit amino acid transport system ATPase component
MKSKTENAEILAIRQKYPELMLLDEMLKGITINESDEVLLDEYFTQRAKEEGIIIEN